MNKSTTNRKSSTANIVYKWNIDNKIWSFKIKDYKTKSQKINKVSFSD